MASEDLEDSEFRAQILSGIAQIDLAGVDNNQQDGLFVRDADDEDLNDYWLRQQQEALNAEDGSDGYWNNGEGFDDLPEGHDFGEDDDSEHAGGQDDDETDGNGTDSDSNDSDDDNDSVDSEDSESPDPDTPRRPPGWDDIWITGDGQRLPEHPYDGELIGYPKEAYDAQTKTVQSFVEVKPGQIITIAYRIAPNHPYRTVGNTFRYAFYLDGDDDEENLLDRHLNNSKYMPQKRYVEDECEGLRLGIKAGPMKNRRPLRVFEPMQIAEVVLRAS